MKYHLYYHDDFDGMASGAVMLNFLRSRGDDIASYNPIDYTPLVNETWVRFKFKKPFILVDFRYHPVASWWFDHHETSFAWPARREWGRKYNNDSQHFRNPKFKSCCSAVTAHLARNYQYKAPLHIRELVKWADIIDSFGYKSPSEALSYSSPALKIMGYLDSESNAVYRKKMIEHLALEPMKRIATTPLVVKKSQKHIVGIRKLIKKIKESARVYGSVVFADVSMINKPDAHHFMIYYLFPGKRYSAILRNNGTYYSLGVGQNKWLGLRNKVDIGKLMTKYAGGGHRGVGATQRKSKKEIMKIAREVIEYLNKQG